MQTHREGSEKNVTKATCKLLIILCAFKLYLCCILSSILIDVFLINILSRMHTHWTHSAPDHRDGERRISRETETQSALVEDVTGKIRLQLWEGQVGLVLYGKTY